MTSFGGRSCSTRTGWRSSTSRISRPSRGERSRTARWRAGRGRWRPDWIDLGIGVGERVAIVSHNSARLLTALFGVSGSGRILVPINFRLVAEEVKYIVGHSGARLLLVDPELEAALADVECEMKWTIGADSDAKLMRFDVEPQPWDADEDATATVNYTSGTTARPEGRAAHTSQHLAQRRRVRLAHGRQRPRRVPAHAAPVPLQRLGDAVRGDRDGRRARDPAQGRRRRDPAPRRPARRDVDVRGAGGAEHDPRRRCLVGRPDPGQRSDAHRGRRRAAADPHDRALRDRARLGVRPDLRPHRDDAGADDEPHPRRMGRRSAPASGR